MNDIQAAMGLVQLEKLSGFLERRGQLIQIYEEQFAETTEIAVNREEWSKMPYYLYWIYAEKRDVLARYLRSVGIYTSFRYWPLHWAYGYNYHLPESEWAARRVLNLPLHNGLTKVDVEYVCRMIKDFSGNGNDLAKQT